MKLILLSIIAVCCLSTTAIGQTKGNTIPDLEKSLKSVQSKQVEFDRRLQRLSKTADESALDIKFLVQRNESLCGNIDSLKTVCDSLGKIQTADKVDINGKIKNTNNAVNVNRSMH